MLCEEWVEFFRKSERIVFGERGIYAKVTCGKEFGVFGYFREGLWVRNLESKWRIVCVEVIGISCREMIYFLLIILRRIY